MAFFVATWTEDGQEELKQEAVECNRYKRLSGNKTEDDVIQVKKERATLETEILAEDLPFLMALSRTPRAMPALKYRD